MNIQGSTVLVIGANGVFGKLTAEKLMAMGANGIGTARSNESAANLPAGLTQGLLLDLESAESIATLTGYLSTSGVQLDGIINLAGVVGFGSATDTTASDAQKLMQVNHLGPSAVISALLPVLAKSEREPFVLSITGVVAEKVFPGMAAYVASKTAHSTWLKALNLEARRMKIRVIDVRPGHTETGLASRAVFGVAPAFPQGMTAEHVVMTIVEAITSGTTELASTDF